MKTPFVMLLRRIDDNELKTWSSEQTVVNKCYDVNGKTNVAFTYEDTRL